MPGLARWLKRRRFSRSAKRRCSSGHRCCVDERPARMNKRSDPRVRTSAGRWNAPRSSWNAPPFAGRCGNRRPQRWLAPRSRGAAHPVRAERAGGSASRSSARTTNEVRGTGSRRGFARRNDGANLVSIRSGPAARPLRRRASRGSSALPSPHASEGADEGEGGERVVTSFRRTRNQAARVGARASSYCRSRQNVLGLKEARHQRRQGRKPRRHQGARERESDHRRPLRRASAGAHRRQKGDGSS